MTVIVALAVVLAQTAPPADPSPAREAEIVKQLYEAGKYREALARATSAMGVSNFDDTQRLLLQQYAGLSAFTLGDLKGAREHFLQLLRINPDHQLDPFAVAPPAVRFFEQLRSDNAAELSLVRQQILLRQEAERRAAEERSRLEEEERRRKEEEAQTILVRTVEKRPVVVNFLPFGAGQFQQGRIALGVGLAVSQAVLAITSIIAFFVINSLYEPYTIDLTDRLAPDGSGRFTAVVRRIPTSRQSEYVAWSWVKYVTGGAFYADWAAGAAVALLQHRAEVVTEERERLRPRVNLSVQGVGAAVTVTF